MEEFNIKGKQTSFYKYCPGTFGFILVQQNKNQVYHDGTERFGKTEPDAWYGKVYSVHN